MKFEDAVKTIKKYGYHLVRKSNSNKNVNESFMSWIYIERMRCEKIIKKILKKYIDNDAAIDELLVKYKDKLDYRKYTPNAATPEAMEELQQSYVNTAYEILEKEGFNVDTTPVDLDKIEEAKRVVNRNGLRFVKESKKYAGKHPVFSSKKFQDYLLKECGVDCIGDECYNTDHRECCDDQDVNICPDCGGEGCVHCNFKGYIEWDKDPNNIPEPIDYNEEVNERY